MGMTQRNTIKITDALTWLPTYVGIAQTRIQAHRRALTNADPLQATVFEGGETQVRAEFSKLGAWCEFTSDRDGVQSFFCSLACLLEGQG